MVASTCSRLAIRSELGNVAPISSNFTASGIDFVAKRGSQRIFLTSISNSATGVQQTVPAVLGQAMS